MTADDGGIEHRQAISPGLRPASESLRRAGIALAVALAAVALVTFCFAPRLVLWQGLSLVNELPLVNGLRSSSAEFDRAAVALQQLDEPWSRIKDPTHQVIAWRLLFPAIWYFLALPRWLYLAMPQFGCLLVLWLTAELTYERLGSWWSSWLATTSFAALSWFFVSSGWLLYFDSWFVIGMLVAAFVPSRVALALACLLTPWVDARFVLALPLTLAVRALASDRINEPRCRDLLADLAVMIVASLPYPLVRLIAELYGDADSAQYVASHRDILKAIPWSRFALGLWSGYRLGWIFLVAAVPLAARRVGKRWAVAFGAVLAATGFCSLFVALDLSRSLMILCSAYLLGIWLWESWRPRSVDWLLPVVLLTNLFFLPAQHVLWTNVWPIVWLPREMRSLSTPPPAFAAARSYQRGQELVQQGNFADAKRYFNEAIDIEDEYPQALMARALICMREGDLGSALTDLDETVRFRPEFADVLMIRGMVYCNRGETHLAATDLRRALKLARPEWEFRRQTEQLLQQVEDGERPATVIETK